MELFKEGSITQNKLKSNFERSNIKSSTDNAKCSEIMSQPFKKKGELTFKAGI